MYGILISAVWTVLSWLFRTVVMKFLIFAVVYVALTELLPIVISAFLPSGDAGLGALFSALPDGVWWFLDLFRVDVGIPALVSAWAGRFIIRRLPVVG